MRSLVELQRAFGAALADRSRSVALAALMRGEPAAVIARLAVYRGNVFGNCAQALAGAYPIVRKIVGAEFFDGLAQTFARAHPSRSGDLHAFGERFPEFVSSFAPTQDLPYLPDVARMEWLAHHAYYAADAAPVDLAALAGTPPEAHARLCPALAPGCALLASEWPLARIWAVHQDDFKGELTVDLDAGPDRILIHRPRWRVEVRSVARGDWRFLESAASGATLGAALEAAASEDPGFDAGVALAAWIQAGVITL
jgi:uncharacterized protein